MDPAKPGVLLNRPYNSYHYEFVLNSSGAARGSGLDLAMESPRDTTLLRLMKAQSRPGGLKGSGNTGISESIAMHQRKLRETEMRIDHALDLVTRSFGVNQGVGFSRNALPKTPEIRRIRETLEKTQRFSTNTTHSHHTIFGTKYEKASASYRPNRPKLSTDVFHSKRKAAGSNEGGGRSSSQKTQQIAKVSSTHNPKNSRVHRSTHNAALGGGSQQSPKKMLSAKDPVDRNRALQLSVVNGNTHILDPPNRDFINTFANLDSFTAIDDSNPAGLSRFRARIDMGGFLDGEITFQCEGKKITILANRPKKNWINARKVTEVLDLPAGVYPEKLRIARDQQGTLYFEERWMLD